MAYSMNFAVSNNSNLESKPVNIPGNNYKSLGYISEITFPENKHAWLVLDKHDIVYDNLHPENINTRGHLLHWIDRQKEIYSSPEVKDYVNYLKSKGHKVANVAGYKVLNDNKGGMIAGVNVDNRISNAVPVIGTDYFTKVSRQARMHGVSHEAEKLYTALHETSHMIRSFENMFYHSIYRIRPSAAEKFVEKNVYEYAIRKVKEAKTTEEKEKWIQVAEIAKDRYENVKRIYSKRNLGKHKEENIDEKVECEKVKEEGKEKAEKAKYSKEKKYEGKKEQDNIEENNEEVNPDNLESIVEGENAKGAESCEGGESTE